jgi:hypothetical protein
MECVDADHQHGAGLDAVAIDRDVPHGHPGRRRAWRAQPQRLVQHLNRVFQGGHVFGCQFAIADPEHLGADFVLHVGVMAEWPQGVGQRGGRRVVTGKHEHGELITDLVV